MPEPWWSTIWKAGKRVWKDEADDLGRPVQVEAHATAIGELSCERHESTTHPSVAKGARSLEDMLAPGVWYMDLARGVEDKHRNIPEKEIELFADLLGLLLKWQPQERISAQEALNHEWFNL